MNSPLATLRIATRKSPLAMWQAEHVAHLLRQAHPGLAVSLVPLSTQGDRIQDRSLAAIGGKGLFIKELETAIEQKHADIAVHSMKDVPAQMPPGFRIGAVLERADPRDALIIRGGGSSLQDLPHGANVGSSSLRRQAQLYAQRPDLKIAAMRGNVDTRLRKLDAGEMDAILLACAGLIRLGLESRINARLDPEVCLPAVGQGVIGIECRDDDTETCQLLSKLEHSATRTVISAERAFAERLGGSCQSPIGAFGQLHGSRLTLKGLVAEPDGSRLLKDTETGEAANAVPMGQKLADRMMAAGAGALLERLRAT